MRPDDDTDDDRVALRVRQALDGVTLQGAPADFVVLLYPKGRAVSGVNVIATAGVHLQRTREACEVAILQIDHTV